MKITGKLGVSSVRQFDSLDFNLMDEDKNIRKEDFRLQAITTLAKEYKSPDTGILHPVGTPITVIEIMNYGENTLTFGLPNMTALFINYSYKTWKETGKLLVDDSFLPNPSKNFPLGSIYPKSNSLIFNLLEKRMASIVFAYSALESFCNESIPDDYNFEQERSDKKFTEKYNKEQIENVLSLDVKLGIILPAIFKIDSPKGKTIWNRYSKLKELRDRIIHIKSKDRKSSPPDVNTIWKELLKRTHPNFALEAKDIIGYFLSSLPLDKQARWFKKFPKSRK